MSHSLLLTFSFLRPEGDELSPETKDQILIHRLIGVLAVVLIPLFGYLFKFARPNAVDPWWARLIVAGLYAGLLGGSYLSKRLCRNYVAWMQRLFYVVMAWVALVAALNHFAGNYAVILLITYVLLTAAVGFGAQTFQQVVWFLGGGLLLTAGGLVLGPPPDISAVVLLGSMIMMAVVGGILIQGYFLAQEKIHTQKERLRSITENVSEGIYRSTPEEGLVYVNQAYVEMFGYDNAEEILQVDPTDLYASPEDRQQLQEEVENQKGPNRTEVVFRRKDGTTFTGLLSDTAVHDEDGEVEYYVGAITDITEKQETERALRRERNRFVTLFEALPTPILHGRPNENGEILVQAVNEAFEDTFGVDQDEIEGEDVKEFFAPPNEQEETDSIQRRLFSGEPVDREVRREAANGPRDFRLQVAVQKQEEGPPDVYAICTDITEQKRREQALVEAKEEAEEAAQLKSALLDNMSHEVRTPLMAMIGYADLLREELAGESAEMIEHIYQGGQRLHDTLDAVLRLSRLESGTYELGRKPIHLNALVREVAQEFSTRAHEKGIEFGVNSPEKRIEAYLGENATRRIVANLLENALKFTPEGGRVQVRVRIEGGETVVLEVEDTGVGIAEDALPEVFEAFKQESEGFARKYEGSGLGLSVAQRLTECMGGTIHVESEKNVGTRVVVRLPRRAEREAVTTVGSNGDVRA